VNSTVEGTSAEHEQETPRDEKREHPRVRTNFVGRYMLADMRESECVVVDVSLGGITLTGPRIGKIGGSVVVYIDQLGRVRGDIVRFIEGGFALKLTLTTPATEKLAVQLDNIQADNNLESFPNERRRELRIEPEEKVCRFSFPLGEGAECKVRNLSRSGADLQTRHRPRIGSPVQLGQLRGKVVHHTKYGVAIAFDETPESTSLTDRLTDIKLPKADH
jgi:hypothetical protein